MKFPFSEQSPRMIGHPDELAPLRELRSPLSTSAIRERVLERMAFPSLWGQLRNILAEFLVVGMASAALLKMAGPVEVRDLSHGTLKSYGANRSDGTDRTNELAMAHAIGFFKSATTSLERANAINHDSSNSLVAKLVAINNNPNNNNPKISPSFAPHPSSFSLRPSSFNLTSSPIWFASASGGAIFSQIRMIGERGEIGFEDGWKTIAFSYANGDGSRDLREVIAHHPSSPALWLSKERDQEFSLLFGATTQAGPFEFRAMAGPAYFSTSSAYYSLSAGTTDAPISLQSFGATAEVSARYPVNGSFAVGIDGLANYRSRQFTGGVFASIEYQFGP